MTSLDGFFAGKQVELTFVYRSRSVTLVKEFEVDLQASLELNLQASLL